VTITRIDTVSRMSQAVIHGDTIYLAGQVGEPGQDFAEQTRTALAEVDTLLARAGGDKSKLLMVTIWLADMADFAKMNAVWDPWIAGVAAPARATAEAKLASPDYLVEVIAIAARA
jgi:enamine deaminase RidA (YjgF/YER057c/UK114 family)